jgi:hypothetical protein
MFELAAMLLPYLATNTTTVNMVKKEVEDNIKLVDLSTKLRKLEKDGFPSLANIDTMLNTEMKAEPCQASPAL